jgi:RimJ/RimL family protein N-acetyltransferase
MSSIVSARLPHALRSPAIELVTPFPAYALPVAWEWVRPVLPQLADDFALRSTDALVQHAERIDANGGKTWGVLRKGVLCGWLSFEPVNEVSGVGHCFFAPWALGRKTTDAAIKLCLEAIFFEHGYARVSCPVLATNWRIRALLRRVGIPEEGILKHFTQCGGRLTDLVMAGITKEDFLHECHDRTGDAAGRSDRRVGERERRGDRNDVEQFDELPVQLGDEHPDLQPHSDRVAVVGGSGAAERDDGRHRHDSDGDLGDGRDQQDGGGNRAKSRAKPGRKRVRKLGSKRNSRAAN